VDSEALFIRYVTAWAQSLDEIAALALVGSYARHQARPGSDIDLILICHDTGDFLDDVFWVTHFGKVKSQKIEDWGIVTSIRVFYSDGKEVEFGVAPLKWADLPVDPGTHRVVTDGMMILDDKRGILKRLVEAVSRSNLNDV
jgi:predicted nucleotidyltransferase